MSKQGIDVQEGKIYISNLKVTPKIRQEIREAQGKNDDFQAFKSKMLGNGDSNFCERRNGDSINVALLLPNLCAK
jgi:hypothetical protein